MSRLVRSAPVLFVVAAFTGAACIVEHEVDEAEDVDSIDLATTASASATSTATPVPSASSTAAKKCTSGDDNYCSVPGIVCCNRIGICANDNCCRKQPSNELCY